jgi:hypothetical protein
MSWTALVLILVMAIAASKLVRHSLTVLAAIATIGALFWVLIGHPPDAPSRGSRESFTSRATP